MARKGSRMSGSITLGNFGDLKHRKWFKAPTGGQKWRRMHASVEVARVGDTGERKIQPYRSIVCVGKSHRGGRMPRISATRCGAARGKTPTLAIRGAFKDLGKVFK